MAVAYQVGAIHSTTFTGYRHGSQTTLDSTRDKLINEVGGDFIVTAGKTLYISRVGLWNRCVTTNIIISLMYDDDGAGTNQVVVGTWCVGDETLVNLPLIIIIPAGKYVTAKSSSDEVGAIYVEGFEV